jgi:transcriptional regulator GlxA family with amidase domain
VCNAQVGRGGPTPDILQTASSKHGNIDQMARDERRYTWIVLYTGPLMNAVWKALWFIETHFSGDVSLDEIAKSVGVSRYYLVRAFGVATESVPIHEDDRPVRLILVERLLDYRIF